MTKSELLRNLPLIVLMFALMMLIGCNSAVVVKPNEALTRDCDRPELQGVTYRDALILSINQDRAILECTERMRALSK